MKAHITTAQNKWQLTFSLIFDNPGDVTDQAAAIDVLATNVLES